MGFRVLAFMVLGFRVLGGGGLEILSALAVALSEVPASVPVRESKKGFRVLGFRVWG